MNELRYIELKARIEALANKTTGYQQQISGFAQELAAFAAEFPQQLASMRESIMPLPAVLPSLPRDLTEQITRVNRNLDEHRKRINTSFGKPMLRYQQAIQNAKRAVSKFLSALQAEPKDAKIDALILMLETSQRTLAELEPMLATAAMRINSLNDQVERLALEVRSIDLPQELKLTTKRVQQLAESLGCLQLQIHNAPQACTVHSKELLFLSRSLETLQVQSLAFAADTEAVIKSAGHSTRPSPSS